MSSDGTPIKIAERLIRDARESNQSALDLNDLGLRVLPDSIGDLHQLRALYVRDNRLQRLPDTLGRLTRLQHLYVNNNDLAALPEAVGELRQLEVLNAEHNRLTTLPDGLLRLTSLHALFLDGNPALGLPPEVLGPNWRATLGDRSNPAPIRPARYILGYYSNKRASHPLNEAKMILLGRGGVGKTSLVARLVNDCFDPAAPKTDGIAITPWTIPSSTDRVRLNIWDFGGQEIMHATHQFFLTKRSLYLVVLNAREGEQDANIHYWLRLVESFGGDSPVLVVINKSHEHRFNLNRRGLQGNFPTIRDFVWTDCERNDGIAELREMIVRETNWLPHLRDPFPASWFAVKDRLADLPKTEGKSFVPFARYREICTEQQVHDATSQETLVSFLHDLGIVVNFREDPRLAETHVLDPQWVTNGIYKILNAETLARKQGDLQLPELSGILDADTYPRAMHLYLLDLMRKFELCYEYYDENGHYLIPELLGKEEPDLARFDGAGALKFEYEYNFLPEGLLPRFIVRSRSMNRGQQRWRSGAVLAWEDNRAVVKADVQERRVYVSVTGPADGQRRLLTVIRADMKEIHGSISKLQVIEEIRVPGYTGLLVPYQDLLVFEAEKRTHYDLPHRGRVVSLDVAALLNGIEESSTRANQAHLQGAVGGAMRVALCYSHRDEEMRDQLEIHLKLLQQQQTIATWSDRGIPAGANWEQFVDDSLSQADLILLLVSPDFLASDACGREMERAIALEKQGRTHVVPVILRPSAWRSTALARFNALPKDGRPVLNWGKRDEAWADVEAGIRKLAQASRPT